MPNVSACSNLQFKRCTMCHENKPIDAFGRKGVKIDGGIRYDSCCKLCKSIMDRARNQQKKKLKRKKDLNEKDVKFTYTFSLATEGPDLKGAIDICTTLTKAQDSY